jgi:hypothetical protein
MNARVQFADDVVAFRHEDPILTARAEAERAIDQYLIEACDGNARAGKIVTRASSVRRTADVLSQVRTSPGDLTILVRGLVELRSLLSS